jgi:hypothetical protein
MTLSSSAGLLSGTPAGIDGGCLARARAQPASASGISFLSSTSARRDWIVSESHHRLPAATLKTAACRKAGMGNAKICQRTGALGPVSGSKRFGTISNVLPPHLLVSGEGKNLRKEGWPLGFPLGGSKPALGSEEVLFPQSSQMQ